MNSKQPLIAQDKMNREIYYKETWNAAIEAAAALLEMDDEMLPYTIEQIRKLKK